MSERSYNKLLEMVKNFGITSLDSYGEDLTDNLILSIALRYPGHFDIMEKYIKNKDEFYYRLFSLINRHDPEMNILNNYKIPDSLERIMTYMLKKTSLIYPNVYVPDLNVEEQIWDYCFIKYSYGEKIFCHRISEFPKELDILSLAEDLVDNQYTNFALLSHILKIHNQIRGNEYYSELIIERIKKHPNFSTAKAVLKNMEIYENN